MNQQNNYDYIKNSCACRTLNSRFECHAQIKIAKEKLVLFFDFDERFWTFFIKGRNVESIPLMYVRYDIIRKGELAKELKQNQSPIPSNLESINCVHDNLFLSKNQLKDFIYLYSEMQSKEATINYLENIGFRLIKK